MSYSILAAGTTTETERTITNQCDNNTSPEMPIVKAFLLGLLGSVVGDDKRVIVDATGYHSSGIVQHSISFRTVSVPPAS